MDEETVEIQRRIAEARGVQERLTELQTQIRVQHEQLNDAIREVSEIAGLPAPELGEPSMKVRHARYRHSGR